MEIPVSAYGKIELAGVIAAGCTALLAMGCLAQDLYDFDKSGSSSSDAQYVSAVAINTITDMGILYAIYAKAERYLKTCRKLLKYGVEQNLTEVGSTHIRGRYHGWQDISPIILELGFVEIFQMLVGFGPPCEGEDLESSSEQLVELRDYLNVTIPDSGWNGASVQAYAGEVVALQDAVQDLINCDTDLASAAKNQAAIVLWTRLALGILSNLLLVALAVERCLWGCHRKSLGYATKASALGGVALLAITTILPTYCTAPQAREAQHASNNYRRVQPDSAEFHAGSVVLKTGDIGSWVSEFNMPELPLLEGESLPLAGKPASAPAYLGQEQILFSHKTHPARPLFGHVSPGRWSNTPAQQAKAGKSVRTEAGPQVSEGDSSAAFDERAPIDFLTVEPARRESTWPI